jgi:hypothetical protein
MEMKLSMSSPMAILGAGECTGLGAMRAENRAVEIEGPEGSAIVSATVQFAPITRQVFTNCVISTPAT